MKGARDFDAELRLAVREHMGEFGLEGHPSAWELVFGRFGTTPDERQLTVVERPHQRITHQRAVSRVPLEVQQDLYRAHRWACLYCGDPAVELDHIHPRALGGGNHPSNLAPACWSCNNSKRANYLWEWLRSNPTLNERAIRARWLAARGDVPLPGVGA